MKKIAIIFYLFLFTLLYAPLSQVNFDDFTGGWNSKWMPNKLLLTQCVDVDNLLFDKKLGLVKRDGYSLKTTINSAGNYIGGIEYSKSTGDKYFILQKGSSLCKSPDLTVWTEFETGLNTSFDCRFAVYMDDLWRVNGNNTVSSYDGVTVSNYSFIPKGRFIVVYNESVFIGNTTDEQSALYFSDVVLGPKTSSAWKSTNAFYVGRNDGDKITGLYVWNGILWIFKKNSIWGLSGYSIDDYVLRQYTKEFGCIDGGAIQEKGNGLVFLSSKGIISFNGNEAEIISKTIEPSINNLSVNSLIDKNWTQTNQTDFQLGTADNVDITNYPGEIRNISTAYKLWTSSVDFGSPTSQVNIDTMSFEGTILNDVRMTEDFQTSTDTLGSQWERMVDTNFPNNEWFISNSIQVSTSNYFLSFSTTGGNLYNRKASLKLSNSAKKYGKWSMRGRAPEEVGIVWPITDGNNTKITNCLAPENGYYLSLVNADNIQLHRVHTNGLYSDPFCAWSLPPSPYNMDGLRYRVRHSTPIIDIARDYDNGFRVTIDGQSLIASINPRNPTWVLGADGKTITNTTPSYYSVLSDPIPPAFDNQGLMIMAKSVPYANPSYITDEIRVNISTWSVYVSSSWDTGKNNPTWEIFNSSTSTYGISDIGFQLRVSTDNSNWDSYIGISHGQTPTNASKRYIQWKATTTVNTIYEVISPEIREIYIAVNSSGSFTSQEKYVGTDIAKWGTINIDDTDNIGYFIAGATSSYNLSIASYIAVSDGGTIPLNTSANYVKWKSTYTSSISQITYGVTLNGSEGEGATGSQRVTSAIFDDRYWLSCSSNNATNNIIYVADSNLAFTKFSNIPANVLFEFNNKKYFASSVDNNIFEFNEINTDSGTAISSSWKSAHTYLGNSDVYKWLRYAFFTGRKQTGDFINFDYSIDNSTITTSQYVSFSDNQNIPKEFGQDIIGKNFYFTIRSTGVFELQEFNIFKEDKELSPLVP